MFDFRTDLADERVEFYKDKKSIDGIVSNIKNISNNISVNVVKVTNENGSKKIDKKIGVYTTINIENINIVDQDEMDTITEVFSNELKKIIKFDGPILVIGLGNEDTTADSIGPKVTKDLKITRHILKYEPELLPRGTRNICAIAPGVLGTTGMETQEILKGIVEKVNVSGIIVIDALASNNISRLLKTIQISDTGIIPGSGVRNKRKEISEETMGVPVVAIGVPTVVEAATIVANTFDILIDKFEEFNFLKDSSFNEKYKLVKTVLEPSNFNLAVMPKEIDDLVDNMKSIIVGGINKLI